MNVVVVVVVGMMTTTGLVPQPHRPQLPLPETAALCLVEEQVLVRLVDGVSRLVVVGLLRRYQSVVDDPVCCTVLGMWW